MGRAPCCDKASVKRGPWSPEEDAKLKAYIEEHGTGGNWIALPPKIGLKRCGKSCRLRWLNYLRPNIKHGGFSEEEDHIICSLYISIGSRWSIIAAQLPGRTDNDIKNYWNTRLKKKLLGKRQQSRRPLTNRDTNMQPTGSTTSHDSPLSQNLSASALERMQLHMQLQGLYNPLSFLNNPILWPNPRSLGNDNVISLQPSDNNQTLLGVQQEMPNSSSSSMEEGFDGSKLLGFPSSVVTDNGNGYIGEPEGRLMAESDSFNEMSWWISNGFEVISSPMTWDSGSSDLQPDPMQLQEYTLGYDL